MAIGGPTPEDFVADVSRWCERAEERGNEALLAIGEAVLAKVKERTPVRTGWLRANWQIVVKGEAIGMTQDRGGERTPGPFSAQGTQGAGGVTVSLRGRVELGDTLQIVNPVSYAAAIEFGREIHLKDGNTKHIAGRAMVQQTMAEIEDIAREAIAKLEGRQS